MSQPVLPEWLEPAREVLAAYVDILATTGVTAGLIGPREVPRLWSRHILNCAVVVQPELPWVPLGANVVDVGSGAGLPGLVWAIARPDLRVTCLEPLLRRATFLTQTVETLGLTGQVLVQRGRAEPGVTHLPGFDVATSRAVAPLPKLLSWSMPLLAPGGRLVAMKGESAQTEVLAARPEAALVGATDLQVVTCGESVVDPPTTLVLATKVLAR